MSIPLLYIGSRKLLPNLLASFVLSALSTLGYIHSSLAVHSCGAPPSTSRADSVAYDMCLVTYITTQNHAVAHELRTGRITPEAAIDRISNIWLDNSGYFVQGGSRQVQAASVKAAILAAARQTSELASLTAASLETPSPKTECGAKHPPARDSTGYDTCVSNAIMTQNKTFQNEQVVGTASPLLTKVKLMSNWLDNANFVLPISYRSQLGFFAPGIRTLPGTTSNTTPTPTPMSDVPTLSPAGKSAGLKTLSTNPACGSVLVDYKKAVGDCQLNLIKCRETCEEKHAEKATEIQRCGQEICIGTSNSESGFSQCIDVAETKHVSQCLRVLKASESSRDWNRLIRDCPDITKHLNHWKSKNCDTSEFYCQSKCDVSEIKECHEKCRTEALVCKDRLDSIAFLNCDIKSGAKPEPSVDFNVGAVECTPSENEISGGKKFGDSCTKVCDGRYASGYWACTGCSAKCETAVTCPTQAPATCDKTILMCPDGSTRGKNPYAKCSFCPCTRPQSECVPRECGGTGEINTDGASGVH